MAETILFSFANYVLGKVVDILADELKHVLGVKNELQNLKHNMSYIEAVLEDAEKLQRTSNTAKIWLQDLESFLYEMDDFLDELAIEAAIRQKIKGVLVQRVRRFFSQSNTIVFRYKLVGQVRNLRDRLELIRKNGKDFRYNPEAGSISVVIPSCSRETSSRLPTWDILGRENDKCVIIDMMLRFEDCANVSVIPIVGSGGLGKTTLAQLIYNDEELNFDLKLWVFVSKVFSTRKIAGEVIRLITGQENDMSHLSLEELRVKLMQSIQSKKYLLILDDMWNDNPTEWIQLKNLLDVGARGSCILATTRSVQVAANASTIVGCRRYHQLEGLPRNVCLLIFRKLVFRNYSSQDRNMFDEMAEEIVDKSGGVPLILTVLGNLLAHNTEEKKWKEVIKQLDHGLEDISSILKLSYDDLSPFLKPCFRLIPIFRMEENILDAEELVSVWIALGFINFHSGQRQAPEEIGLDYIKELWSKSIMYDATHYFDYLVYRLKMHDCTSDLALSLCGNETIAIHSGSANNVNGIDERVKHILLKYDDQSQEKLPRGICKASKARLFKLLSRKQVSRALLEEIITGFKKLRVLDFSRCQFEELPRSICKLKHLRFLNVSGNTRIKYLPNSISELLSLQILYLHGCEQLQKIPVAIGKLKNLRYLSLTTQQEYLPEEMGKLTALYFLSLMDCPNLVSLPRSLENLISLETLCITGSNEIDLCSQASAKALQGLNKLNSLYVISVDSFEGLPRELENLATSLERLVIFDCDNLEDIGWIDQFTCLKRIFLKACPGTRALPTSFSRFRNLQFLEVSDCFDLDE